jgi:Family of unknown function (DUF6348)
MFGFRKKVAPKLLPSNPGKGVAGKVGFSNAERTWSEKYNLVALAASVLADQGHKILSEESWLVHQESGFILLPQFVHLQPLDKGGVRTTTTIQAQHPVLVSEGVFEYQHSTGDSVEDSIRKGFDQWAHADFVALLESLQPKPQTCTTLRMDFPEKDGKPAYSRRAVLGPVAHFLQKPHFYAERKVPKSGQSAEGEQCESHDFCPYCLLTNSFDAFKELIEGSDFFGLRLFAACGEKGALQADCRVNGVDWEKGAEALRKYATTWPEAGYEFRKQYVVLHTIEKES